MTKEQMVLKSHPHLRLNEHISQVKAALQNIIQHHSAISNDPKFIDLLDVIAKCHDIGKSTLFFQDYIKDPENYTGNKNYKNHTPLSTFLTLLWLREHRFDELESLLVIAVISGHHSRFPTLPVRKIGEVDCPENDIDRFLNGTNSLVIKKQLDNMLFSALQKETQIDFLQLLETNNISSRIRKIKDFLYEQLIPMVQKMDLKEAVRFRLKCQLAFSLLLESDKAFLAVSNPKVYLQNIERKWNPKWVDKRIGKVKKTDTNRIRQKARNEVIKSIESKKAAKIFNLTAPTGLGKTLLAATWAFKMREYYKSIRKVIVVLPFLSVVDQTIREYKKLLEIGGVKDTEGWLMSSHSLSDRIYDSELSEKENSFLVDTWRGEIIITTYDQFLLSLMEPKGKYQMRFHNLCDAVIIMDEVQSLPCKLWQPLSEILEQLTMIGNSKVLLMSATLPPFIKNAEFLLNNPAEDYFYRCNRYCLKLCYQQSITLEEFCLKLNERLPNWLEQKKRVLLTFNTRKCARKVRDYIDDWYKGKPEFSDVPLYFISADVIPKHRLDLIKKIKEGEPCIVVSTQCIEAGVDIDMDHVIRDFGPLDSLIQLGGRCNREGEKPRGIVEIIDLKDEGRRYSEYIYDEVHLQVTRALLDSYLSKGTDEILEENIFSLTKQYFEDLYIKKDRGNLHLERFARWKEDVSVRELLRGKEKMEYTFLVLSEDSHLRKDMLDVSKIKDQWSRRESWRKLAGRIASVSVNIFARPNFHPESIAEEYLGNWILKEGFYSKEKGLILEGEPLIL